MMKNERGTYVLESINREWCEFSEWGLCFWRGLTTDGTSIRQAQGSQDERGWGLALVMESVHGEQVGDVSLRLSAALSAVEWLLKKDLGFWLDLIKTKCSFPDFSFPDFSIFLRGECYE